MKKILFIIGLLIIAIAGYSQPNTNYQKVSSPWQWRWGIFDSTLATPYGDSAYIRHNGPITRPGFLFTEVTESDTTLKFWTGERFKSVGTGSGDVDTFLLATRYTVDSAISAIPSVGNIYTTDGTLSGDRTIDMDGRILNLISDGESFIYIDPTPGFEASFFQAYNKTGLDNFAVLANSATDTHAQSVMEASFNAAKQAFVIVNANDDTSLVDITADSLEFDIHRTVPVNVDDSASYWMVVMDRTTGTVRPAHWASGTGGGAGGISEAVAGFGLLNINDSTLAVDTANADLKDWVALYGGGGGIGGSDTLYVERGGDGVPMFFTNDSALVIKDILGEGYIETGSLTDSTAYIRHSTAFLNRLDSVLIDFTLVDDSTIRFWRWDGSYKDDIISGGGSGGGGSTVEISPSWFVDTLKINSVASSVIIPPDVVYDEFISTNNGLAGSSFTLGTGIGTGANAAIGNTLGTVPSTWHGAMIFQTGSTGTGMAGIATTSLSSGKLIVDTTKNYRFETVLRLPVLSAAADSFRVVAGFVAYTTNYTVASNDIHFRYSHGHNSGAWTCYNNNTGGAGQTTNTAVTVVANTDYRLGIEFDGEQILFYINGTLVATHTNAMPTHASSMVFPVAAITKTGGSTRTTNMFMYADWFKYRML